MVARSHSVATPLPRRREFHVVIDPRFRRRPLREWVALAIVVLGSFFSLIASRIALDHGAFRLEELEGQVRLEEARYWELRLQVSELQAPDRIARLAGDMGMVYPSELRTIEVPGLGQPGPGIEERWVSLKALLSAQP